MATKKKVGYSEPSDFFPKSVRKANKIGEYAEKEKKPTAKKTTKKVVKKVTAKKK